MDGSISTKPHRLFYLFSLIFLQLSSAIFQLFTILYPFLLILSCYECYYYCCYKMKKKQQKALTFFKATSPFSLIYDILPKYLLYPYIAHILIVFNLIDLIVFYLLIFSSLCTTLHPKSEDFNDRQCR